MSKKEAWEQNHINALTLRLILSATVGTLAATAIALILKKAGLGEIKPELLFIPWGIALVYGVSLAFHRGVVAERERAGRTTAGEERA
jgi:hypothetical protein